MQVHTGLTSFNLHSRLTSVPGVLSAQIWAPGFPNLRIFPPITVTSEGWVVPHIISIGIRLSNRSPEETRLFNGSRHEVQQLLPPRRDKLQLKSSKPPALWRVVACSPTKARWNFSTPWQRANQNGFLMGRVHRNEPDRAKHRNTIRQHFEKRAKDSFGYWNGLSFFIERSVFRAGLRIQCPNCAYYNWITLT